MPGLNDFDPGDPEGPYEQENPNVTTIITPTGYRKAYSGTLRLQFDGGGPVYAFANSRVAVDVDEGNDYPDLMDSQGIAINRVPGFVTGTITARGMLKLDRGFDTFLTGAFGPRSAGGKLTGMVGTILPASGQPPETFPGVYWNALTLTAAFGTSGQVLAVAYEMSGFVLDPKNALAAASLGAGVNEGVPGVGISTFATSAFVNGATTYDGIRRMQLAFNNRMSVDPSAYPGQAAARIVAGYTPGTFMGMASLSQLQGCAQPLPYAGAANPLTAKIPSGDGTKLGTLDLCLSYDGHGESYDPSDYNTNSVRYHMFYYTSANTTGAAAFPFTFTVA